jgi:hypothetical protein
VKSRKARKREAWKLIVWEIVAIAVLLVAYTTVEGGPATMALQHCSCDNT